MSLRIAAVPFYLSRSEDSVGLIEVTETTEKIHGLLRLEGDAVVVQWRIARKIERVGLRIETDRIFEPVREARLPLAAIASASVRQGGWYWLAGPRVVLTAADLTAFETIAGASGLKLDHPATLVLKVPRRSVREAREFAIELNLAAAERMLESAEEGPHVRAGRPPRGIERPPDS